MKIEWKTDKVPAVLKLLVSLLVGGLLTAATLVWAASADWTEVQSHTRDEAKHMTPEIHQQLGAIDGKLDLLIQRIPHPHPE